MTRVRVPKTGYLIENVEHVDELSKYLRDHGMLDAPELISSGINYGKVLDIGCGTGIQGLEWLTRTTGTTLVGLDINKHLLALAQKNAAEYHLTDRASYVQGNADERLPFEDATFDGVFSTSTLRDFHNPVTVFKEIARVLKPGGIFHVSDMRRDMNFFMLWYAWLTVRPRALRQGFLASVRASYTAKELSDIVALAGITNFTVSKNIVRINVVGTRPAVWTHNS